MKKILTICACLFIIVPLTALAQDSSTTTSDHNAGRPIESHLYEHLKNAFVNPKDDPDLPRVLLIGDSISIGYTVPVRSYLDGKANVHRPTENCQHTAHGMKRLEAWLGSKKWDVIHFNWGIWDTHYLEKKTGRILSGPEAATSSGGARIRHTLEEYRENLTELVTILKATNARLIWASSTPIMFRKGERFDDIAKYNQVAESVMKEQGVEIDDLYRFTLPGAAKWQTPDQCHFNATGNQVLGKKVGDAILGAIEKRHAHAAMGENPLSLPMPKVEPCEERTIAGRKTVRYEHESLEAWKYPKPQRNYFFVVHPKVPPKGKVPLRVFLHSAGGSGESEMNFNIERMRNDDFYAVCLDCRGNQETNWWWGYHSIKGDPKSFENELYATEKRVLATVAWVASKFNIDTNRIYLSGVSMGGSGSLGIGLRRGDLFAAISVTVPAGADHALFRMDGTQYPDPPPLFNFSAQNDNWSKGQSQLIDYCQKQRYPLAFAWGPLGHINDRTKFNATVAEFPWLSIRKNEAYPVFTSASSDNVYPGFQNLTAIDQNGQINGCFRWKNLTDTADQFAMELRLVRKEELENPVETPNQAEVDVTLRRLQCFLVKPGQNYQWRMTQNGQILRSGKTQADDKGVLTIPRIQVSATPSRLEVTGLPY